VQYPVDAWKQVIDINLTGVFLSNAPSLPAMVKRGWGRIVNIASVAGRKAFPTPRLFRLEGPVSLASPSRLQKLATAGVLVNCVAPAVVRRSFFSQMTEQHVQFMLSNIPMKPLRRGRRGRRAGVVARLAALHLLDGVGVRSLGRQSNVLGRLNDVKLHDLTLKSSWLPACRPRNLLARDRRRLAGPHRQRPTQAAAFTEVYAKEAKALADAADTTRASGYPARAIARPAVRLQRPLRHRGRVGTGGSKMWKKASPPRRSKHGRAPDAAAGAARQAAHGRVRLRRLGHQPADGRAVEPLDLKDPSHAGRIVERHRRRRGGRLAPAGIGSDTGGSVRIPAPSTGWSG